METKIYCMPASCTLVERPLLVRDCLFVGNFPLISPLTSTVYLEVVPLSATCGRVELQYQLCRSQMPLIAYLEPAQFLTVQQLDLLPTIIQVESVFRTNAKQGVQLLHKDL